MYECANVHIFVLCAANPYDVADSVFWRTRWLSLPLWVRWLTLLDLTVTGQMALQWQDQCRQLI